MDRMKPFGILASAAIVSVIVVFGGDASARYLQPEPLQQNPNSVPDPNLSNPYVYAKNNPSIA